MTSDRNSLFSSNRRWRSHSASSFSCRSLSSSDLLEVISQRSFVTSSSFWTAFSYVKLSHYLIYSESLSSSCSTKTFSSSSSCNDSIRSLIFLRFVSSRSLISSQSDEIHSSSYSYLIRLAFSLISSSRFSFSIWILSKFSEVELNSSCYSLSLSSKR